jgi:outer membrane protein TolC
MCTSALLRAQTDSGKFNLSEAIAFAEKNSPTLKNAVLDRQISNETVKQIASAGLPQLSATGNLLQYVQVPGNWVKNFIPSPGSPEYVFIRFQQPINASANITMNQLIYSGTFLLGLKAAREFTGLSTLAYVKTKADLQVNVAKAYLMALTVKKNIDMINSNLLMLEKSLADVEKLNTEGFAEKLDVQRLKLAVSNLKVQKEKLLAASDATLNLLKLQMGFDVNKQIELTDDLESIDKSIPALSSAEFDVKNRVEFKMINQGLTLSKLEERRYKVGKYPTLVGFFQHQQSTQRPEFNFFQSNLTPNNNWVPSSAFGLSFQMTLFDGFRAKSSVAEIRLKREKTMNDLFSFTNAATMEYNNAVRNYNSSAQLVELQKENMDLARDIYTKANLKYKEGVGSSLEVVQAENDLKTAQTNYLNAIYDLVIAKIDLKKANGTEITQP